MSYFPGAGFRPTRPDYHLWYPKNDFSPRWVCICCGATVNVTKLGAVLPMYGCLGKRPEPPWTGSSQIDRGMKVEEIEERLDRIERSLLRLPEYQAAMMITMLDKLSTQIYTCPTPEDIERFVNPSGN